MDTNKFYSIFKQYFPEDNFEALKKKLYISTTNIIRGKTKFFHEGQLIHPLLASAAVPGVFSPMIIKNELYADGGIANNFPTEPLMAYCDKTIGVHVHPLKKIKAENLKTSFAVMERAYLISSASHSMGTFGDCDLIINPEALNRFGTFSMNHVDDIFQIGYEAAIEELKSFQKPKTV
ncbi:MAG: NTE family protein [Polaribacter sp.]